MGRGGGDEKDIHTPVNEKKNKYGKERRNFREPEENEAMRLDTIDIRNRTEDNDQTEKRGRGVVPSLKSKNKQQKSCTVTRSK